MTVKQQTFLSWYEQVQELNKEYNIHIESKKTAIHTLKKYSYETLVDGYKDAFSANNHSNKFLQGITIETLGVIQMLENRLSSELMQALLSIERNMKSLFQYELAKCFGVQQEDYLSLDHYNCQTYEQRHNLTRLFKKSRQKKHVSKTLQEHRANGNVPPWVLINEITFGQFQHWFMVSPVHIQQALVEDFQFSLESKALELDFFQQSLRLLLDFRNGLAHGELVGRLRANKNLPLHFLQSFYTDNLIDYKRYQKGQAKSNDLFTLFLLLGIFLKQSERQIFKDQLLNLLKIFDSLIPLNTQPMRQLLGNVPNELLARLDKIL